MTAASLAIILPSIFLVLITFLPLIRLDCWQFRIFDYPRVEKLFLLLVLAACWLIIGITDTADWICFGSIIVAAGYLVFVIYPYTPFAPKMIGSIKKEGRTTVRVLTCNVYQENSNFEKVLQLISNVSPDIVFLVEVDYKWIAAMQPLYKSYPERIEIPKSNTYGMALYSRLPIDRQQINYLIDDNIPSIDISVTVDGKAVRIFGLHPTPPVPQENDSSTERDAEILLVGKKVSTIAEPCMVIGDLNDVAWSYTTSLFLKTSHLLDPRRGRGFYNTFHAKWAFMRWPLDHFFVSRHFGLVGLTVHRSVGSDHFPICIEVAFSDDAFADPEYADHAEKELAQEKIKDGLK